EPDPTAAVLVDETGSQGWAVGGEIETLHHGALDTADIARYPADGSTPPGIGSAPLQATTGPAAFPVPGNAQWAGPASGRENDRLGPDVWLSTAVAQAGQISGVRGFFNLGPRITSAETSNKKIIREIPYPREFARFAQLMQGPIPTYPVPSPTDNVAGIG